MRKKLNNIADYLDEQIMISYQKDKTYPLKFELPEIKIKELEEILSKENLDGCWIEKRKEGRLSNYKGIPLEILK